MSDRVMNFPRGLFIFASFLLITCASVKAQEAVPNPTAPAEDNLAAPQDSGAGEAESAGADTVTSANALPPEVLILNKIEEDLREKYKNEIYIPPSIPSLLFTSEQQSLLREARNGFNTRIPLPEESKDQKTEPRLDVENRKLSLSGIVFINPDEWTIWLNKKRITNANLPTEAVDLRVYKDFIELKWFDAKSNQIFPIRLRPNQTFSLDARSFVPG